MYVTCESKGQRSRSVSGSSVVSDKVTSNGFFLFFLNYFVLGLFHVQTMYSCFSPEPPPGPGSCDFTALK